MAILYATVHGYLKDIEISAIASYERELYQCLDDNADAADVMEQIRTTGDLKAETEEKLKAVLEAFTAKFQKEN